MRHNASITGNKARKEMEMAGTEIATGELVKTKERGGLDVHVDALVMLPHRGSVGATKASPVDMRKALVFADLLKKAGVLFVPVPVLNKADGDALCTEAFRRMDLLEKQAEAGA
jgi:hypothetical protein